MKSNIPFKVIPYPQEVIEELAAKFLMLDNELDEIGYWETAFSKDEALTRATEHKLVFIEQVDSTQNPKIFGAWASLTFEGTRVVKKYLSNKKGLKHEA